MKKFIVLSSITLIGVIVGCGGNPKQQSSSNAPTESVDSLQKQAQTLFSSLPSNAKDSVNTLTEAKILLGKSRFFDNRLSKGNTQSCNSCHNLATFGVDNKATSTGDLGKNGNRNSPSVFNAALHIAQFWDGRAPNVEEQAGGPILNPVEMNMPSEKAVEDKLKRITGYQSLFSKAFPDDKAPITYANLKSAIGAFERTLMTPSKFDNYLDGDAGALNDEEKEGLKTFIEVGCITCHNGVAVGGGMFQKFPLLGIDYKSLTGSKRDDKGKMEVSKSDADKYIFKVPSLRNITETYPYFHDGSVDDLGKAIAIMGKAQLNKDLSETQIASIKTFLSTLKGSLPQATIQAPTMPQ